MAVFIVSFRLEDNSTYSRRWQSMVDAINRCAIGGRTWDETTSFVLLEGNQTAEHLVNLIYLGAEFNSLTDTLLVVDVTNKRHATMGVINRPATLAGFFGGSGLLNALAGLGR